MYSPRPGSLLAVVKWSDYFLFCFTCMRCGLGTWTCSDGMESDKPIGTEASTPVIYKQSSLPIVICSTELLTQHDTKVYTPSPSSAFSSLVQRKP